MTMNHDQFTRMLATSTIVKWQLFNKLREEFEWLDFFSYERYQKRLAEIPQKVIGFWQKLKTDYEHDPDTDPMILKGFLFEALFYYACLKSESVFKDAEIMEFGGHEWDESLPWLEATPLYDVIPPLHHLHSQKGKEIKAPQTRADFLVTYADHKDTYPPSLVDVKSRKPDEPLHETERWRWQILSAMRRGFIFELAYPKEETEYPASLDEWELTTPCIKCGRLSNAWRQCEYCGETIFPFTISDAIEHLRKTSRAGT